MILYLVRLPPGENSLGTVVHLQGTGSVGMLRVCSRDPLVLPCPLLLSVGEGMQLPPPHTERSGQGSAYHIRVPDRGAGRRGEGNNTCTYEHMAMRIFGRSRY